MAALLGLLALCGCHKSSTDPAQVTFASALATVQAADTSHAYFTNPNYGALGTGAAVTFQWTAVTGATHYQLEVGTTPGGHDLYESGLVTTQSMPVTNLPASGVVYARVRGLFPGDDLVAPEGYWPRGSDLAFRTDSAVSGADFLYPTAGITASGRRPVVWQPDPVALSYRLRVGSSAGGNDIDDSGPVNIDRRLLPVPAAGTTLYASLDTVYASTTVTKTLTFTSDGEAPDFADRIALGKQLTAVTRLMAGYDNDPHAGTLLDKVTYSSGAGSSFCNLFAQTLMAALSQANSGLTYRNLAISLNGVDSHDLVEVLDTDLQRWQMLDPTFGLVTLRSDGTPATASDVSGAARSLDWTALKFEFLTPAGAAYAQDYYLDYPLLFINVETPDGSSQLQPQPSDLSAYFTNLGDSVTDQWNAYSLLCTSGQSSVNASIDGTETSKPCVNGTHQTAVVLAATISPVAGDSTLGGVAQARRFVFQNPTFATSAASRYTARRTLPH